MLSGKEKGGAAALGQGEFSFASQNGSLAARGPITPAPTDLDQTYTNDVFGFVFKYPSTYTASSLGPTVADTGDTILVQNNKGSGFQIVITPFDEEVSELTEARVRQDIPDMKMEGVMPVLLGANGKGLAFASDNEAFDGASREVWFVYKGYLYQISTYLKDDPLLQAVFGTWQFR